MPLKQVRFGSSQIQEKITSKKHETYDADGAYGYRE